MSDTREGSPWFWWEKYQHSWPHCPYWIGIGCFENEKKIVMSGRFLTSKFKEGSRTDPSPWELRWAFPGDTIKQCAWIYYSLIVGQGLEPVTSLRSSCRTWPVAATGRCWPPACCSSAPEILCASGWVRWIRRDFRNRSCSRNLELK